MTDEEKAKILNGKELSEISGEEAHSLIDSMSKNGNGNIPASDKQIALIIRLTEKLKLDLDTYLKEMGHQDLDSLTGSRDGTASKIIGDLIYRDKDSPATEKQIGAIENMSEKAGISIEDAMALVEAVNLKEITKEQASKLITILKKLIRDNRGKGKK
jgi:hypothetical protein